MPVDSSRRSLRANVKTNSIQSKYILPFLLLSACSTLLLAFALSRSIHNLVAGELYDNLRMTTDSASAMIEQRLVELRNRLTETANDSAVRAIDPHGMKRLSDALLKSEPAVLAMYVIGSDGQIAYASDGSEQKMKVLTEEPCFQKVFRTERSCYTDLRATDRKEVVSYLYAPSSSKTGRVVAMLVAKVNLHDKRFTGLVNTLNPGRAGFAYLTDSLGNVIVSGEPPSRDNPDHLSNKAIAAASTGTRGQIEYSYQGRKMLAYYTPIDQTGWALVVQRPKAEISALARRPIGWMFFVLGLTVIGAVAFSVMQTQSIARFIFFLRGRMKSVTAGEIDQDIYLSERNDEFAELYLAFNDMLASLRRTRDALESQCKTTETEGRFHQALSDSFQDIAFAIEESGRVAYLNRAAEKALPDGRDALGKLIGQLGAGWSGRDIGNGVPRAIATGKAVRIKGMPCKMRDGESRFFDVDIHPFKEPVNGRRMAVAIARDATDLVMEQSQLKASEQRIRKFGNGLPDALLVIGVNSEISWANRVAVRLAETSSQELIGSRLQDWASKATREAVEKGLNDAFVNPPGAPFEFDMKVGRGYVPVIGKAGLITLDDGGKEALVTLRRTVREPAAAAKAQNLTQDFEAQMAQARSSVQEEREARAHTERRLRFYSSAVEALPNACLITDEGGKIMTANRACERTMGRQKAHLIGKHILYLFPGWKAEKQLDKLKKEILKTGFSSFESQAVRADGKTRYLSAVAASAFQPDAQSPRSLLFLIDDISEARRTESARTNLERRALLENACRIISRRLEPPIQGLRDSVSKMSDSIILTATTETIFGDMASCLKRLTHTQNNLLQFSTFKKPEFKLADLQAIAVDTLSALDRHGAIPPRVRVELNIEGTLPQISLDPDLMMLAIWNLALNSAQSINGDGLIRVGVADCTKEKDPFLLVEISDSGRGISENDLPHIFEPFYSRMPGGIGLGLSLAKKAVEAHSGRIEIESQEGSGTRAFFSIPVFKS